MVYWNKIAKQVISKIEEWIKDWKLESWFFIIAWPKNIWKKTLINKLLDNLNVFEQDKLIIEDPGKYDGKLYQIKIDVDEKDKIKEVWNKEYLDFGARQISDFVSKTPAGEYKFIFIENLERLNNAAWNSLLKILEEPPKNTFIFATTSNKNKLLTTILSRWTIINMFELNKKDFKQFLDESMITLDEHKFNILYAISWWRIGLAKRLLEENNNLLDKIEEFLELSNLNKITNRFNLLKELTASGKINLFLDWLIFYYSHTGNLDKVDKLIDIKIKNQANVNLENLLFEYLI